MASSPVTANLEAANRRLRELISRMLSRQGQVVPGERHDIGDLLIELSRVAVWVRQLPRTSALDVQLANQVSEYRASLEQLRQALPAMHERWLREKVRLEAIRNHVAAATAWAGGYKQLL